MVGVHSDLEQKNWRIVLYNGDGCYQKELFSHLAIQLAALMGPKRPQCALYEQG